MSALPPALHFAAGLNNIGVDHILVEAWRRPNSPEFFRGQMVIVALIPVVR